MGFEVEWWYKKVVSYLINLLFSGERTVPCTGHRVFMVGKQGGPAYPALLQSHGKQLLFSACSGLTGERTGEMLHLSFAPGAQGCWPATAGEGRLAAWLHLLWHVVCFSCLGFNLGGLVEVPLQHPPRALQAGGPHPHQGKSQGRRKGGQKDREGGIFVKMEDKAAPNMELGCAETFSLGHCGPSVLVVGAPRVWQSSDCSLLERGSLHSYGKKQALLEHSILQKGKKTSHCPWREPRVTVSGWRPVRGLPPLLCCSDGKLPFCEQYPAPQENYWRFKDMNLLADTAISVWKVYIEWGRKTPRPWTTV